MRGADFIKSTHPLINSDTIAAIATPHGVGGIAVIRVSGPEAITIVNSAWKGKSLEEAKTHTVHLGKYVAVDGRILDECVAAVYRAPATFTGEDTVEISIHGSKWIQKEVLRDLITRKARAADAGEFTRRAFLNGRIDLAQAEGIADLISASSKAAHALAVSQTSGRFSKSFESLREQLIEFASLLELELDFSEEEVEFADREKMLDLSRKILKEVDHLRLSYSTGKVIKEGVPVVIAGVPNAGKSSLLNLLLNDDKAIVSNIPGTTRDIIEDTLEIDGIIFRLIDTAGIRESDDEIESIGIRRARERVNKARLLIWVLDITTPLLPQIEELEKLIEKSPDLQVISLLNKIDIENEKKDIPLLISERDIKDRIIDVIKFSTKTGEGLELLRNRLVASTHGNLNPESEIIITNARHYEALTRGEEALSRAIEGIENGISGDFISQDVREALHHLGTITGAITTPALLQSIFSRFCIGK